MFGLTLVRSGRSTEGTRPRPGPSPAFGFRVQGFRLGLRQLLRVRAYRHQVERHCRTRAGAVYAENMDVSGGKVTIRESTAQGDGGSGGVGVAFSILEQGTRDDPTKKWHAERHGLCSFAAEGSSRSRLERFAGR